ncbi:MAG TPA: zinc-dependent alcohol dehydrogenase family protein [Vicinamibacterales bacterium]|nr:zinc-dependent alcohol dehydrogenase family protein [Vicinamibacterales bacterium]
MQAMTLRSAGAHSLEFGERDVPIALPGDVVVRVRACGVCRTDLHIVDGEMPAAELPIIPGHEIVGVVEHLGDGVSEFKIGERVGIPWLGYTCGVCEYCTSGRENLCREARFTGYQIDGGYAEYVVADARYVFRIPDGYSDTAAAPLLCAGLIGYRAYRMTGNQKRLGVYGFGAAAHIITQVAVHDGRQVYAFTSPGDDEAQQLAMELGATWAGASTGPPPEPLDAAIIFAPIGALVPEALSRIAAGGVVVCAGIHMSDIPSFPYLYLWGERILRSVANLTRQDAIEFLRIAPTVPVKTHVQCYPLADANRALADLREGRVHGAAVLAVAS